jgi:hypothetical protein
MVNRFFNAGTTTFHSPGRFHKPIVTFPSEKRTFRARRPVGSEYDAADAEAAPVVEIDLREWRISQGISVYSRRHPGGRTKDEIYCAHHER